jgi:hypothetical protein
MSLAESRWLAARGNFCDRLAECDILQLLEPGETRFLLRQISR